jgi:hypothetical protein
MYEREEVYTDAGLAQRIGVKAETIRRWRQRGMLPPHDAAVGGDPGYLGHTLNRHMRVADALARRVPA